ncbi:two component transcriptional regulator, LuxR family [Chryseobacterium wanjuense]|uniref:Two component transcriptional regulator, LuxR family n=1 Tax=Chryseobacterium wanjuense TaxID=356305 RepID=A0A1I0QK79_9FLAO|nr:response regulator transcription factor [Chryseobacterium wanjuense]SEW27542.1 two component transcriptional regulator, LuxR family [Chryseobacterium wanjuense]
MINIVIADDHEMILEGLESVIKNDDNLKIVGRGFNGKEVISLVNTYPVDIVVLDINMPIMDGIETTKLLKERNPNIKVLILTMHDEIAFIRSIIQARANGYILKNKGKEELLIAIYRILDGKDYFSDEVTQSIIANLRSDHVVGDIRLTNREKDVLYLIAEGLTTLEISEKLNIASTTVETHRRNLLEKTGVKNSKALIKFAIQNGYSKPL